MRRINMENNDVNKDNRTVLEIMTDMQNLLKINEIDVKKSMEGNISAGIRVRHVLSEIKKWCFIAREKVRENNGKYYDYKIQKSKDFAKSSKKKKKE